jgi:hypothetical protein
MKKIFYTLILLSIAIGIKAQEVPPVGIKAVNAQFYINPIDSSVWHNKGAPWGWERLGRYKDLLSKANVLGGNTFTGVQLLNSGAFVTKYGVPFAFSNPSSSAALSLLVTGVVAGNHQNYFRGEKTGVVALLSDIDSAGIALKVADNTWGGINNFNYLLQLGPNTKLNFQNPSGTASLSVGVDSILSGNQNAVFQSRGGTVAYLDDVAAVNTAALHITGDERKNGILKITSPYHANDDNYTTTIDGNTINISNGGAYVHGNPSGVLYLNYTSGGYINITQDGGTQLLSINGYTIKRLNDNKYVLFEGDVYTKSQIDSLAASTFSLNQKLYTWTNSTSFSLSSITRNSDGAIVTGTTVWPDGSTGSFITDTFSTLFPGAIDAFHVTYVPASGPTKTITQSLLTRDASGAVTVQPVLTITP